MWDTRKPLLYIGRGPGFVHRTAHFLAISASEPHWKSLSLYPKHATPLLSSPNAASARELCRANVIDHEEGFTVRPRLNDNFNLSVRHSCARMCQLFSARERARWYALAIRFP